VKAAGFLPPRSDGQGQRGRPFSRGNNIFGGFSAVQQHRSPKNSAACQRRKRSDPNRNAAQSRTSAI
jgi:hypothetical protein